MFEIEKNFDLKLGDKERLIEGAEFVRKNTFTDVYYDNNTYDLTGRDLWFRTRDGKFELKVPLNNGSIGSRNTDQYRELETDQEIAQELGFSITTNLSDTLAGAGYKPFATIVTTRETYQKDLFHLDFDEMDFGYTTFEAELMVSDPKEIPRAEARILEFAREHDILATAGHGKVIEYLSRNSPKHYAFLVEKGVVIE